MSKEAKNKAIRDRLREMASTYGPAPTLLGTVKSVSETQCIVVDEDFEYDVRLQVVLDGTEAQTVYPKVGAQALAIRIENSQEWYMVACSELDKWRLSIAQAVIEQDANGLQISKGTNNLKDALIALIEGVEQIVVLQGTNPNYVKIAQAKTKINAILR